MCYSAEVQEDYRWYIRTFGAKLDIADFVRLYTMRLDDPKIRIGKAMDAAFADPQSDDERQIKSLIDQFSTSRPANSSRTCSSKRNALPMRSAHCRPKQRRKRRKTNASPANKIAWSLAKLSDLRRSELKDHDSRIFPGWYAPVMIVENGQRVIKPMRYQCRPAGKPAFYDTKYPGTYNARRDNLEGFWKGQFGHRHGLMVVSAFYENVSRHRVEGRELGEGEQEETSYWNSSRARRRTCSLRACGHTGEAKSIELLSFAAITDEPPAEIAAAGHDRCIIPIKPEHVDAWLESRSGQSGRAVRDSRRPRAALLRTRDGGVIHHRRERY